MATKQEIMDYTRRHYGNMLNIQQATELLGFKDRRAAKRFLEGVAFIKMGKETKYLTIDVVRLIYDRQEIR